MTCKDLAFASEETVAADSNKFARAAGESFAWRAKDIKPGDWRVTVPEDVLEELDGLARALSRYEGPIEELTPAAFELSATAELMARVDALLRRAYGTQKPLSFGEVTVDFHARKVRRDGAEVTLSRKELDLLLYMVRHPDRVLSRDEILDSVWGDRSLSDARSVDYHILNLRRKLERDPADPDYILTRHGLGYQLRTGERTD